MRAKVIVNGQVIGYTVSNSGLFDAEINGKYIALSYMNRGAATMWVKRNAPKPAAPTGEEQRPVSVHIDWTKTVRRQSHGTLVIGEHKFSILRAANKAADGKCLYLVRDDAAFKATGTMTHVIGEAAARVGLAGRVTIPPAVTAG